MVAYIDRSRLRHPEVVQPGNKDQALADILSVNNVAMGAFNACWYNFARINSSIRITPAVAAGLEQRLWEIGDIVKLIEGREAAK